MNGSILMYVLNERVYRYFTLSKFLLVGLDFYNVRQTGFNPITLSREILT